MMSPQTESRRKFIINFLYVVIILGLAYIIFKHALPLLMPFVLALLCAMLQRPFIKLLRDKCRLGTNVASFISLLILFVVIIGITFLIVLRIVKISIDFFSLLPDFYADTVAPALTALFGRLDNIADRFDPNIQAFLDKVTPQIISAAGSAVSKVATTMVSWVSTAATKVPTILISCIMFFIGTIFITFSYDRINSFFKRQLSERSARFVSSVKQHFLVTVFKYGKGYLLIMLITFAEIAIGLLIIGVKNAVLLALLIAVFDIFPIVGAGTILIPWAIIDLIIGNTTVGVSLLILYIVEIAIREIIEPKIIGQHVGLHPVMTLICMYVGTKLFGAIGLLGLPITAAIVKSLNMSGTLHFLKYDSTTEAKTTAESEPAEEASAAHEPESE